MRHDSITDAIGNTPLVRIDPAVHGLRNIDLYAKMELLNPFGSLKDRAACGLVAHKSDFIPGIRTIDEVHEVGLFDPGVYDAVETITADEAIDGLLTLVRRCGTLAGPTGGGAYEGAVRHLRTATLTDRRTAVFIVCDRVESYMSYLRDRRPELFGRPARRNSVRTLTDADMHQVTIADVGQAQRWIADRRGLVVDLRSPHAFRALHIDGSINIVDELFADLVHGGLPFGRSHPVLLVCPVRD